MSFSVAIRMISCGLVTRDWLCVGVGVAYGEISTALSSCTAANTNTDQKQQPSLDADRSVCLSVCLRTVTKWTLLLLLQSC